MVDDSPAMRRLLESRLRNDDDIQVVGVAGDPYEAREEIARLAPDVITLDIEMPRMSGLTFLQILMRHHPIPTIVVSTLAGPRNAIAVQALQLGAIDALSKTDAKKPGALAQAIRLAASTNRSAIGGAQAASAVPVTKARVSAGGGAVDVIAIGISTGGPQALARLFAGLPAGLPPIVVVQHMPPDFTAPLAARLDGLSAVQVSEATHGRVLQAGQAVIAPGSRHLTVRRSGSAVITALNDDAPVQYHRPSVDVLFMSLAKSQLRVCAGVMTGMGRDGADGLLALRRAGAQTFSQDEGSSLVYGMPREALANGGSAHSIPLDSVADYLANVASPVKAAV